MMSRGHPLTCARVQAVYLLTSSGKEKGKHNADAHHDKAAKAHAPSEELVKKEEAPAPAEVRAYPSFAYMPQELTLRTRCRTRRRRRTSSPLSSR